MRLQPVASVGLAVVLGLAGCATTGPGRGEEVATARVVAEGRADLVLWVSNQSFADDPVHIEVIVDGTKVVDRQFEVGSQHTWVQFPLALDRSGRHAIVARSDTGVAWETTFRVPRGEQRYAVVEYWNYEDRAGRHFTWHVHDEPVAFM